MDLGAAHNVKPDSSSNQELAGQLILEWQYLFSLRGNWNTHWTEIAQRIYPMDSFLFQGFRNQTQGDKRNFEVFDSTGILALQRFGAILDSLLTPQNQRWHRIEPQDPKLLKDKACRLWYEEVNNTLFRERYAPRSNFAAQNQLQYLSLGAYGTGCLFIDDLAGMPGLRYRHVHLGEVYLQENHQGLVDSVCRYFMLTARQAVQKWADKCPENIREIADKFPERQFYFLHWVKPNPNKDSQRKDFKGMDFSSYYISIEGQTLIEEKGYRSFPYAISRYFQAANEAYGRSPAMDVLPALKTLNEQKKTLLKQGHRAVDPVLLAHDDGVMDSMDLTPGATNFGGVSKEGRLLVQPLPIGNVQVGKELMEEEINLIKDTFLISLFQILTEHPEMTATEVAERVKEKGILLAPTIGRQHSEYQGPMIEREIDILNRQGKLPPQPLIMKQMKSEYKHVYDSPISKIMRAEESSGTLRTLESLSQLAQMTGDPSVLDVIDIDSAAADLARSNSVPERNIRSPQEVAQIKAQRQKMQQQQQAIQAAPAMAGLVKAQQQ